MPDLQTYQEEKTFSSILSIALSLSALYSSKVLAPHSGTTATRQQLKISSRSKVFIFAILQGLRNCIYFIELLTLNCIKLTYFCAHECVQVLSTEFITQSALRFDLGFRTRLLFLCTYYYNYLGIFFKLKNFQSCCVSVCVCVCCTFRKRPRHNLRPVSARILLTISADFVL